MTSLARSGDEASEPLDVAHHCGRHRKHIGPGLIQRRNDLIDRHVTAEESSIPPRKLEEVGDHPQSELVKLPADTARYEHEAVLWTRHDLRIELRYDELRYCGAEVLLRDADCVDLPEPAYLVLDRLQYPQVNLPKIQPCLERPEDQCARPTAVTGEKLVEILSGERLQRLAGMWEFRNRNVFGSTAFSTYGGFWIGLGLWALLVAPHATSASAADHDLGWILLAFAIFNTYMLLMSTQVNTAVFVVFATLEITEILLFIGNFAGNTTVVKAGGIVGVITARCAWYTSAAGVSNGLAGSRIKLPVGKPLISAAS